MRPDLESLYRKSIAPIAFIDESFETRGDSTFYILAIALIKPKRLETVRARFSSLNAGHPLHASDLNFDRNTKLLMESIRQVASDHDNADVIVATPLTKQDLSGEEARQRCLRDALPRLQAEFGTKLFIVDSRGLKDADESDRRTMRDLRRARHLDRETEFRHVWPTEEILLSLPDLIAWAYRQKLTKGETTWFDMFDDEVKITYLPTS